MKYLLMGIVLFAYNYIIWGQRMVFPNSEEKSNVSGSNIMVITKRPSGSDECPKNMIPYRGDGVNSTSVCDCRSLFLYIPTDDSCYEAYRQGPCSLHHFVILPKDEVVPRCEANPCFVDGLVPFNNTCHFLKTPGGPCGSNAMLIVNETTLQLECIATEIVPFVIIDTRTKICPAGSRRSTLGECKKLG